MKPSLLIFFILALGGCAYAEQAFGTAQSYYDAKVVAWFKSSCSLNVGAVGRRTAEERETVRRACPFAESPKPKE